jgi:hypothetical protein
MGDVYAMAADLLARVGSYFAEQSVTLPGARYVAPGDSQTIAYDGESVQVCIDFVAPGQPGVDESGQPANTYSSRRYAQYAVTVLRDCALPDDGGNPPPTSAIQADATTNMADVTTLHAALEHVRAGVLSAGGWAPQGTPVTLLRTQAVGPAGAVMAAVGVIQAVLE